MRIGKSVAEAHILKKSIIVTLHGRYVRSLPFENVWLLTMCAHGDLAFVHVASDAADQSLNHNTLNPKP